MDFNKYRPQYKRQYFTVNILLFYNC